LYEASALSKNCFKKSQAHGTFNLIYKILPEKLVRILFSYHT